MSLRLEKRDIQSATLICLLTLVLGLGIYLLMTTAANRQLRADAEHTSRQWADYFSASLEDLEQIVSGARPSDRSLLLMWQAEHVGNVFRYKIFDREGYLRFVSDDVERTWFDKPKLDKHNPKAATAIKTGMAYTEAMPGTTPDRPNFYAETYLPITKNGKTVGIVEVYVDLTARYEAFNNNFLMAILATLGLVALAFGVPAAAFYVRTRQKEKADAIAKQEQERLSVALANIP